MKIPVNIKLCLWGLAVIRSSVCLSTCSKLLYHSSLAIFETAGGLITTFASILKNIFWQFWVKLFFCPYLFWCFDFPNYNQGWAYQILSRYNLNLALLHTAIYTSLLKSRHCSWLVFPLRNGKSIATVISPLHGFRLSSQTLLYKNKTKTLP